MILCKILQEEKRELQERLEAQKNKNTNESVHTSSVPEETEKTSDLIVASPGFKVPGPKPRVRYSYF